MEASPKELVIIAAQPDDLYFYWQLKVQITNLRKYNLSSKIRYLMVLPHDRLGIGWNPITRGLEQEFPEVKFFWYKDEENLFGKWVAPYNYIPLLRPWVLSKHFKEYPELSQKAILYIDSDIVFTRSPDFLDKFKDDDICYLSNTNSYLGVGYWDSKIKDVREDRLEAYKLIDPLDQVARLLGINREIVERNDAGSGGAQYLLKNIDYKFWDDVFKGCIRVRSALSYHMVGSINNTFFSNEDKGFQSWCADMISVLWNLWKDGKITICPPEMDFAWATDKIKRWDEVYIYHDAGASPVPFIDENGKSHILFFKKGRDGIEYANNLCTPFDHELGYISPDYCSYRYVQEIQDARKSFTNT